MMITYEYRCESCGLQLERRQAITEEPMDTCPECRGKLNLVVSGGSGFMIKGDRRGTNGCSLESSGRTCCGREERCGKPPCETGG